MAVEREAFCPNFRPPPPPSASFYSVRKRRKKLLQRTKGRAREPRDSGGILSPDNQLVLHATAVAISIYSIPCILFYSAKYKLTYCSSFSLTIPSASVYYLHQMSSSQFALRNDPVSLIALSILYLTFLAWIPKPH